MGVSLAVVAGHKPGVRCARALLCVSSAGGVLLACSRGHIPYPACSPVTLPAMPSQWVMGSFGLGKRSGVVDWCGGPGRVGPGVLGTAHTPRGWGGGYVRAIRRPREQTFAPHDQQPKLIGDAACCTPCWEPRRDAVSSGSAVGLSPLPACSGLETPACSGSETPACLQWV